MKLFFLTVFALLLAGCGGGPTGPAPEISTPELGDLVRAVQQFAPTIVAEPDVLGEPDRWPEGVKTFSPSAIRVHTPTPFVIDVEIEEGLNRRGYLIVCEFGPTEPVMEGADMLLSRGDSVYEYRF